MNEHRFEEGRCVFCMTLEADYREFSSWDCVDRVQPDYSPTDPKTVSWVLASLADETVLEGEKLLAEGKWDRGQKLLEHASWLRLQLQDLQYQNS